jgi:hypothetical protein
MKQHRDDTQENPKAHEIFQWNFHCISSCKNQAGFSTCKSQQEKWTFIHSALHTNFLAHGKLLQNLFKF